MTFNDSVEKAIKDIESLNKHVDTIKTNDIIGNICTFFIIYFIFTFIFYIPHKPLLDLIMAGIVPSLFLFFTITFIMRQKLFKKFILISETEHLKFYNKLQKQEIQLKYNNLDENTKFALDITGKIHNEIKTHLFLNNFIFYYIEKQSILTEYKDILQFVSETEYDINKQLLFNNILDKLIQEDSFFYKKYKDELVDYIYNSNLKDKKLILSLIKEHIKNNSDVDSLYSEINDIKIKKEE